MTAENQTAATRAADWGARALNLSFGSDTLSAVGANDRFYDEIVHNRWRTVVKSAGNRGAACIGDARVTSPGLGYNVTTVGNFDDAGTAQWGDDSMSGCSSFVDPISRNGDREKPELAAPGTNITMVDPGPANQRTDSGTSFAAPHVTGTTALLIQKNGRLAIWPEIVRAVLMASATHNIEGATRLSDQDGAGGLAADRAAGIVENPAAWNGVRFDCSTPRTLDLTTRSVGRRTHHRVAISWTTDPSFSDYTNSPSADIDLAGRRPQRRRRRQFRQLGQRQRDRRVRQLVGRHLHRPGCQLPLRQANVPRMGVGHVADLTPASGLPAAGRARPFSRRVSLSGP